MSVNIPQTIFFLGAWFVCLPQTLVAEESNALNPDYYYTTNFSKTKASPTFSMAAPSGLTPNKAVMFAGIGGITDISGSAKKTDGAMAVGYGTDLPFANMGAAFTLDLGSINPSDGGMFNRGDLGVSIGKFFKSVKIGVSVGMKNITLWHAAAGKDTPSTYIAATKIYKFQDSMAIFNAGLGNNAFRIITDDSPRSDRIKKVSPFASAAYYPIPQLSLVADYTAGISTIGFGVVPVAAWPVSLSLGLYDIGKAIPNRPNTSIVASMSSSYSF